MSRQFFEARRRHLLSSPHFTVDGTLLESRASMKSLRPRSAEDKPGGSRGPGPSNPDVDFRGQRRSNDTHVSGTDLEAQMAGKGKGKETRLCFTGHVLMENRHGRAADLGMTLATGSSERDAVLVRLRRMRQRVRRHRGTLGADQGGDVAAFVRDSQDLRATPHVVAGAAGGATPSWPSCPRVRGTK